MTAYSGNPHTSAHSPAASVVEDISSNRSFLSRIAFPIRSRARPIADFHIRPAEPHRKYAAGDHVQGSVVLTVVKPIRITHLTVTLHGFIRVYKNPNNGNEQPSGSIERPGTSGFKYFGNGHASLFQDEQVLSADGKLEPGRYEFGFDLEFPSKGLPSSIDFERGTIKYMITATLTRPTPISPTQSCERMVELVESVDIGPLTPPRAQTISLKPISKRSKRRKQPPTEKSSVNSETPEPAAQEWDSIKPAENSAEGSVAADDVSQEVHYNQRSPIPSDIRSEASGESGASESTGRSRRGHDVNPHQAGSSSGSQGVPCRQQPVADERTITATVEMPKGGCLRGEVVTVKISVQHIKRIRSMFGVIVTLYRQGRIDSAPPASLFTNLSKDEKRRLEKDDLYPRSKTGLGGLSLTSASSCHVFRKDLSQSFSPLIIDPISLKSSVTASVRVPEECFPTIGGVPGEMISFKYQLEVLVDLGGKLANLLQSGQSKGGPPPPGTTVRNPYEPGAGVHAAWGGSIIDTDPLRREKGVINVSFEVVVGTQDTSRQRGRGMSRPEPPLHMHHIDTRTQAYPDDQRGAPWPNHADDEDYQPEDESPYPYHEQYHGFLTEEDTAMQRPSYPPPAPMQPHAPYYIPPPDVSDEAGLSEKERIRRAEQRLLPSQPSTAAAAGPSSSSAPHEEATSSADVPSAPEIAPQLFREPQPNGEHAPSAPTLDDLTPAAAAGHPTEDKQELERQRLLNEASAPPDFPEDYDAGQGSSFAPSAPSAPPSAPPPGELDPMEPSAPALTDEEEYGAHFTYRSIAGPSSHAASGPAEQLPRYER